MKTRITTSYVLWIFLVLSFTSGSLTAQGANEDLFGEVSVRDEISLKGRPIYYDNEDRIELDGVVEENGYLPSGGRLEYHYLSNRRALTGESCAINKLPSDVTVGGWTGNLNSLLNDDLNDYCEFNAVANVGVTVNPVVSVRDRSCYYAKGTEAGFCLVAGSGNTVLSLDVVKALAIGFYRDGELVGVVAAKEGQAGSGVTLSLVQIPGTDESCVSITADAPGVFDEVMLDYSGGVNVGVGQVLRVKYSFVGRSRMFTITKNPKNGAVSDGAAATPFQKYDKANKDVDLDYVKAWNPVLLGLPFPVVKKELERFIDADLDNYISLTPIIAVGYQGGAKFMMEDKGDKNREVFEAGTEVGFCYDFGAALTLDLGTFMNIVLFDHNGNKVADETVSAGVLSLSVAKGGGGSTSLVAKVPFSGAEIRFLTTVGVDLGGIFVKYAYVREGAEVRHHCPINPSMDTSVCLNSPDYQLRSNPAVSVTWTLEDQPEGADCSVTPDGYVTGMKVITRTEKDEKGEEVTTVSKNYTFRATAADGCSDLVTLTIDGFDEVDCINKMTNTDAATDETAEYELNAHVDGVDGGLLIIDQLKNAENILRDDESYATYTAGMKIANNVPIVGVKRKNGLMYDANHEFSNTGKRFGFIVKENYEVIDLSVLNFYVIRCYRDGKLVWESPIDESNTISAGIGGSDDAQKMRYTIVVPPIDKNGKVTQFDQIILWSAGVIELDGNLEIYNLFWEDPASECSDVMGCGTTILSSSETHTTLDFGRMVTGDAVALASAVNDLDNIVDDDMDSCATIFKSVGLSGVTIAVNLGRTLDYRHQLGIVLDNKSYVAGVKVADVIEVETLYRGEPTGDKFDEWNIIDANVIGYGDRRKILVQPKYMYDEVLITFVGTVNVLNDISFYGLFIRGDVDGDGVPDCQDSMPCSDLIARIDVNEICAGEDIIVNVIGKPNTYPFTINDPSFRSEETEGKGGQPTVTPDQAVDEQNFLGQIRYKATVPGMYQVVVYDQNNKALMSAPYKVHPNRTRWLKTASSSDWNKWDNWSDGAPYCCTDVIIPSDADLYPDLDGTVEKGDEYCCDRIHFEPGAEVNSVLNLNYSKAWVEAELLPNRYHLLSAPLQGMYTGDMFIPAEMSGVHSGEYFQKLDGSNTAQNRFDPTIYQRLWYSSASERLWVVRNEDKNGNSLNENELYTPREYRLDHATSTKWSKEFNHLATPYTLGMGFSLWVDNGTLPETMSFRFRFPKEHNEYDYFNDFTRLPIEGVNEKNLDRKGAGRFIYETLEGTAWKGEKEIEGYDRYPFNGESSFTFHLSAPETTGHFLFGNPFMTGIDAMKFLEANNNVISGIMTYDGNTTRTLKIDREGNAASTGTIEKIAPLQSVFLISRQPEEEIFIHVDAEMLKGGELNKEEGAAIRLRISNDAYESAMLFTRSDRFANEALLDNEVQPRLAIFMSKDGKAYDIASLGERTPLTLIKAAGEEAVLDFDTFNGVDREDFLLLDLLEGKEYTLDHPIALPAETGLTVGRYVLLCLNPLSGMDSINSDKGEDGADVMIWTEPGKLIVRSLDAGLSEVAIHDISGACVARHGARGASELTMPVIQGIVIVRVTLTDGTCRNYRLLVR